MYDFSISLRVTMGQLKHIGKLWLSIAYCNEIIWSTSNSHKLMTHLDRRLNELLQCVLPNCVSSHFSLLECIRTQHGRPISNWKHYSRPGPKTLQAYSFNSPSLHLLHNIRCTSTQAWHLLIFTVSLPLKKPTHYKHIINKPRHLPFNVQWSNFFCPTRMVGWWAPRLGEDSQKTQGVLGSGGPLLRRVWCGWIVRTWAANWRTPCPLQPLATWSTSLPNPSTTLPTPHEITMNNIKYRPAKNHNKTSTRGYAYVVAMYYGPPCSRLHPTWSRDQQRLAQQPERLHPILHPTTPLPPSHSFQLDTQPHSTTPHSMRRLVEVHAPGLHELGVCVAGVEKLHHGPHHGERSFLQLHPLSRERRCTLHIHS